MIFTSFSLIIFVFLIYSYFAGNLLYFINPDSILFIIIGSFISAFTLGFGNYRNLFRGLRELFVFKFNPEKNINIKKIFAGLTISIIALGICSTIQGIIAGIIGQQGVPLSEIFSYASFTTLYGLLIGIFLFFPVYIRNK